MMKLDFLIDYLIYFPLTKLIVLLTRILPMQAVFDIGKFSGLLMYYLADKRRKVANNNLKAAFGNKFRHIERKKIIKGLFKNFGINFMELFFMPRMDKRYFDTYTKLVNVERIDEALKLNKGIVFLTAHFGNWELCASVAAYNGYKIFALAREQKPYFLNNLLNHYRQIQGTTVIQKGMQLREIVRALKKNGLVGFIGDQSGRQGEKILFFNRPIFMAEGAFRIAASAGSVILPAFNVRRGLNHNVVVEKPIKIEKGEDAQKFVLRAMLEYRDLLEKYITKFPNLWLWGNRRWKYTSAKTVLILKDGRVGHLRQAQAVAKSIQEQTELVKITEIDLEYKNLFLEKFLNLSVLLFGKIILCPLPLLAIALKKENYKKMRESYSDIVICTGSATRAVGILLGKENQSKVISIMKPSPFSTDWFDLSIIAKHDRPKHKKGVLISNGALNLINPEYLKLNVSKLKENVKISDGIKLGLLIGGDSKNYSMRVADMHTLVNQVKKFAEEIDAQILLTTSRRTPKDVTDYFKNEFKKYSRCVFKIFPLERNVEYAVGGILGVCSVVIVSGESISMVSEAASSGAYTIVFSLKPEADNYKMKHELFLENLRGAGYARTTGVDKLYEELKEFYNKKYTLKKLNDIETLSSQIKEHIL